MILTHSLNECEKCETENSFRKVIENGPCRQLLHGVASPQYGGLAGSILSVESNQKVESKMKNVESKIEKCVVQNSICMLQEIRYFEL